MRIFYKKGTVEDVGIGTALTGRQVERAEILLDEFSGSKAELRYIARTLFCRFIGKPDVRIVSRYSDVDFRSTQRQNNLAR
jgi:hypothetical protein